MSERNCSTSEIVSTIEWISDSQTKSLTVCSLYASFLLFSIPNLLDANSIFQILLFQLLIYWFMIVFCLCLMTAPKLVNRLQLHPHPRFFI